MSRRLKRLELKLEPLMLLLSLGWLALLVYDLTAGPTPWTQRATAFIWAAFLVEFSIRLYIAPNKPKFLLRNWLSLIALAVPALRIFRIFRFVRLLQLSQATRGISVVSLVTGFNRGTRAVGRALGKRGFGYAVIISALVILLGSAGMYSLERANGPNATGFQTYWDALWWTGMLATTTGTDYWPRSPEGRVLAFLIAIYAFSVFGYVAATLASAFVDQDRRDTSDPEIEALRRDVKELTEEIRALRRSSQISVR